MKRLLVLIGLTFAASGAAASSTCPAGVANANGQYASTFFYDANYNLTQACDPRTTSTTQIFSTQSFDPLNRPTVTTEATVSAGSPVITTAFDGRDQVISVQDPRGRTTSYTVDGLGKVTVLSSPDSGTTQNTFDALGNLKTSTDARNAVSTFSYDVLNRVTSITYAIPSGPTSPATAFYYDGDGGTPQTYDIGHLTLITDESGSTRFSYDGFGRIVKKIQITSGSVSQTVQYGYSESGSSAGLLSTMTYPSGDVLTYSYDVDGRISAISATHTVSGAPVADVILSGILYDPFGQPKSWTWGNGSTYSRTFDLNGRLAVFPLGGPASANALIRTLVYDPASNVASMTHTDMSGTPQAATNMALTPDNLNRLVSYSQGSASQAYQYDLTGNRTSLNSYTNTVSTSSNQITATSGPAPARNNTYAAGYLTADGTNSYVYSARGRMQSANTTSYLYNGLGQRVYKTNSTATNRYFYDEAGRLIGEYDASGTAISETVYLGDMPIALLRAN